VHSILRIDARNIHGRSLLHLAVDKKSSVVAQEFYSKLPDVAVVKMLTQCGANTNAMDEERNTPLHICAENLRSLVDEQEVKDMQEIISILLSSGAHIDCRNSASKIAGDELLRSSWCKIKLMDHISLKCLASRAIQNHKIPYKGEIPSTLGPFVELH